MDPLKGVVVKRHPVATRARETVLAQQAALQSSAAKPTMAQLRARAVRLLTQIKRRETARVEGARGRTGAAAAGATSGTEAVLINSMTQMAQDMHKIDGRVEKLTTIVESKHAGTPHAIDMAHPAESRSRKQATSTEVRHLEKEMAKYKKQARAEKQELSFEQSVPSQPAYQYQEPDHTTPLFGQGGSNCGTLCKLKQLVKKTRNNISKELDSALDH